jgi:hypothetical protein
MARYNLNDRYMPGGSMDPVLSAQKVDRQLNAKIGARMPNPLVRATTGSNTVSAGSNDARRRAAGLASRFIKD